MGANDAAEQLAAAIAECARLEREIAFNRRFIERFDDYTATCERQYCARDTIAMVIDMESGWHPLCGDHALEELGNPRERGA